MSESTLTFATHSTQSTTQSLLVTWQNAESRKYFLMGRLTQSTEGTYEFAYYPGADAKPGFRPVPGFPDVSTTYSSTVLFPLFSSRLMSDRRPDRAEWLKSHGLRYHPEGLSALDLGGLSTGDTLVVVPEPGNHHDQHALSMHLTTGAKIGYVPAPLLDYMDRGGWLRGNPQAFAVHVNPQQYGFHQRVILGLKWAP